jgi:hypothetical protein
MFCRMLSAMLTQPMSVESTRSIPESMSPGHSCGGFNASGYCYVLGKPRVDSASLMHPSNDLETRPTLSSSSKLTILGRLIDLR